MIFSKRCLCLSMNMAFLEVVWTLYRCSTFIYTWTPNKSHHHKFLAVGFLDPKDVFGHTNSTTAKNFSNVPWQLGVCSDLHKLETLRSCSTHQQIRAPVCISPKVKTQDHNHREENIRPDFSFLGNWSLGRKWRIYMNRCKWTYTVVSPNETAAKVL